MDDPRARIISDCNNLLVTRLTKNKPCWPLSGHPKRRPRCSLLNDHGRIQAPLSTFPARSLDRSANARI